MDKTIVQNRFYYAKAAYGCKFYIISQYEFLKLVSQEEVSDSIKGEVYYYLGLLAGIQNKTLQKQNYWQKAIQFDIPQKNSVYHSLGKLYYQQRKFAKASLFLEKTAKSIQDASVYFLLAESYIRRPSLKTIHIKKAIEAYSHCIEMEPWKSNYYYRRGLAYAKWGKFEIAESDFIICSRLEPTNIQPAMQIIQNCFHQGVVYNYDKVELMLINFRYASRFSFHLFEKEEMELGRFYIQKALKKMQEKIQTWSKRKADVFIKALKNSDSSAMHVFAKTGLLSMYACPELHSQFRKILSKDNKSLLPIVKKRFVEIYKIIRKKYLERKKIQYAQLLARYYNGRDRKALLQIYHSGNQGLEILAKLLQEKNPILAHWAAECLAELRTSQSLKVLKNALNSKKAQVRLISHVALNPRKKNLKIFQEKFLAPYLRAVIAQKIPLKNNPKNYDVLLKSLKDSDIRVRLYAAKRLRSKMLEQTDREFVKGFQSKYSIVRAYSHSIYWKTNELRLSPKKLKNWEKRSMKNIPFLIKAIEDKDPRVKCVALTRLATLRKQKKEYVDIIARKIEEKNDLVRFYALMALGFTKSKKICKVIYDEKQSIVFRAAAVLGLIEGYNRLGRGKDNLPFSAFSHMTRLMNDKDPRVRILVYATTGKIRVSLFVNFFKDTLLRKKRDRAAMIGSIIASLRRTPKVLYFPIKKMMKYPDKEVQTVAAAGTFFIGIKRRIREINFLHHKIKKSSKKHLKQGAAYGYARIIRQQIRNLRGPNATAFCDWSIVYSRYIQKLCHLLRKRPRSRRAFVHLYSKAIELDPEKGTYWFERGVIYFLSRQYQKSLKDIQRAIAILRKGNNSTKAWERFSLMGIFKIWLAKVSYLAKHYELAYKVSGEILKFDPWNREIRRIKNLAAKNLKKKKTSK